MFKKSVAKENLNCSICGTGNHKQVLTCLEQVSAILRRRYVEYLSGVCHVLDSLVVKVD